MGCQTRETRKSGPRWLALALFLLGTVGCASPPPDWQAALHYEARESIPLEIGRYGFPYLRVAINGHPVEVALDTANMSGLLLVPSVADRLGLQVIGHSEFYDSDGRHIGARREYRVASLRAFGSEWRGQVAYEDDRNDVQGFIGPRFLLGRRFTLDYRARVLAVSASRLPAESFAGTRLPLLWSSRYPGMLVVRGAVNGRPVSIQLDTGKSRTCVDPALVARLGLPSVPGGVSIRELSLGGVSLMVSSAKVVSLGALGQDLPEPVAVGIGSDVLSRLLLTVDYPQRVAFVGWR
jgi:predicted aspartyl protease